MDATAICRLDDKLDMSNNDPLSDSHLLQKAGRGEIDAFEMLYHRHKQKVASSIYSIVKNIKDAEDLVQETFVRAHRNISQYDQAIGSFEGWLRRIALNCTFMALRKSKNTVVLDPVAVSDLCEKDRECVSVDSQDILIHKELKTDIESAISRLPDQLRDTFRLAVLERKSYIEVSKQLGVSVAVVKVRVFRTREMLKSLLREHLDSRGKGKKNEM